MVSLFVKFGEYVNCGPEKKFIYFAYGTLLDFEDVGVAVSAHALRLISRTCV